MRPRLLNRFRPQRSERGAALMLIALSMTGVLATVGVIVDGGHAFSQRRQMQNSADSAALAGARALDRLVPGLESTIWNAVVTSATANAADAPLVTCRLATDALVDLGPCPTAPTGTAAALRAAASAVRVTVAGTKETAFIRVVGADEFTARASATAQIQGLRAGSSPFALCAVGDSDPRAMGDGQAIPIILPDNTINPLAIDPTPTIDTDDAARTYDLQNSSTIGCGQGTDFKGLAENLIANSPVPGPFDLMGGTHGSNVSSAVVAGNEACRGDDFDDGCIIAVPLCHAMDPPSDMVFYCQRFAAFRVVDLHSSSRIAGVLVDGVHATGGAGGGHAELGEIRIVKLSE